MYWLSNKTQDFDQYKKYHIPTVLKNLIVSNIQQIQMEYTGHQSILKSLAFPFFKDLKKLNLGNNFISNVQFFAMIPAPNLEHISLNENKIQNLKSFHKNRFDKLKSIDLRNNAIHDLKGIESLSINELILENIDYDKTMSESLLNVFKLPCMEFKILRVQGFQRIPQSIFTEQLQKRWPKMWIYKKREQNY